MRELISPFAKRGLEFVDVQEVDCFMDCAFDTLPWRKRAHTPCDNALNETPALASDTDLSLIADACGRESVPANVVQYRPRRAVNVVTCELSHGFLLVSAREFRVRAGKALVML
jgi:hypothetical protein